MNLVEWLLSMPAARMFGSSAFTNGWQFGTRLSRIWFRVKVQCLGFIFRVHLYCLGSGFRFRAVVPNRWAMAPYRISVCLNLLSGGEKHPS